jgi:prepilin-type N-terminal cleavage/methylation domain-containing protein
MVGEQRFSVHTVERRPQKGFTLIELLVVVSVIALLIALLLPALRNAKAAGQRAQCLSNLRQIGIGFHLYVEDFRDTAPDSYYIDITTTPAQVPPDGKWMLRLAPYWGVTHPSLNENWSANNAFYAPNFIRLLQCPSTFNQFLMWGPSSYGMNEILMVPNSGWTIHNAVDKPMPLKHNLAIKHTPDIPMFADSVAVNMILPNWNLVNLFTYLHLEQRDYVFLDGHAAGLADPIRFPDIKRVLLGWQNLTTPPSEMWGWSNSPAGNNPFEPPYSTTP